MLEPELHHNVLGSAVLQVDVHDPGVLRHPVLLRFVGHIVLLPPLSL